MSKRQDHQDRGIPTREIHEAYRECLRARKQYVQVRTAGPQARSAAQHDLHAAVGNYYEALRSVSSGTSRSDEYWEGSKQHHLWTEEHYVVQTDAGPVRLAEVSQEAITEDVLEAATPVTEYVGLEVLEDAWATVEHETKTYRDATGVHHTSTEYSSPLPVEILIQTARVLDELAADLGLLADISEATPRTEITDELLEEVKAWREAHDLE